MNKKGLSPLIASVLLMAFVILVSVLVTSWVRNHYIEEPEIEEDSLTCKRHLDCVDNICYKNFCIPEGLCILVVQKEFSLFKESCNSSIHNDRYKCDCSYYGLIGGEIIEEKETCYVLNKPEEIEKHIYFYVKEDVIGEYLENFKESEK